MPENTADGVIAMDPVQTAVDLTRSAFLVAIKMALPLLVSGLIIGVIVSVLQAATSVQEQTLTFVPKILVVALTAYLMLPWMARLLIDFSKDLIERMPLFFSG